MIEKVKNSLAPKLLAIFFIYYHIFGFKFVMFTILERLDLSLTEYHYPVLNIFTILFIIVLVIYPKTKKTRNISNKIAKTFRLFINFACFWGDIRLLQ